jgi:outer membrane protein OmpA-like peptidoglycan-associated protein
MMDSQIQALCPQFRVNSGGKVESAALQSMDRDAIAAGGNSTGCCCLSILTDATTEWTIEVSSIIGAQTDFASHKVFLNPTNTPVEFGAFTGANTLAFQGAVPTAGHELCGHAALEEVQAHPSDQDRLRTDVHDPTVRIENQVSTEQGVAAGNLRGLAASGSHRGESVDKITIRDYPFDAMEVPASEQNKLRFAAQYIFTPGEQNEYVSVVGHSDNVGSAAAKQAVSTGRAQKVKAALRADGVPETVDKHGLPNTARFTRVEGVSDSQPPAPPLDSNPANWRRVDILMSGFPAGAQAPPAATPSGVAAHTQSPNVPTLKASSDPCIKKLVTTAYP